MGGYTVVALLGGAAALLTILVIIFAVQAVRREREAVRLHNQIMRFLSGEIKTPGFSVRDNRFALFENAVIELETRLMQSEENRLAEIRKNEKLLTDISHQLKTPISGLKLYCEMDAGTHVEQQLKLLNRMEHLIGSLLRLERLRADGFEFHFEMQELSGIARDALARVMPLFPGRQVEVTGKAELHCDEAWMGEAISNLFKNACEHTREDGRISVAIEQTDSAVLCTVQDDGGGVPQNELGSLFRRFFRSSASAASEGVGVGLAIVRAIVEKHHGTVSAENAQGGLKVTICLPLLHRRLKKT
jgi:signal transduction histidine kinase